MHLNTFTFKHGSTHALLVRTPPHPPQNFILSPEFETVLFLSPGFRNVGNDVHIICHPTINSAVAYMTFVQKLTFLSEMDQLCPPVIMHLEHWHSPEEAQQAPVKASFCCLRPFRVSDHSSSWMVEKEGSHLLETLSFFMPANGSLLYSLPLSVNFLFLFSFLLLRLL